MSWRKRTASGIVTRSANYTHVGAINTGSLFVNIQMPIFDRNQGEIARTQFAITQSQDTQSAKQNRWC